MEADRVQVISTDVIKPSSETPPRLRKHKLSYLDQIMDGYAPLLFFYKADDELKGITTSDHARKISQRLKYSLSKTLVSFYPLAGRIQDKYSIDCNDEGVVFAEARARGQLMDIVEDPHMEELQQYLPVLGTATSAPGVALFHAQVTFFDCGGFTVGLRICHRLADGKSMVAFTKEWASVSRGEADVASPLVMSFDLANYFPARDFPDNTNSWDLFALKEKSRTKRFIFDKKKVTALRRATTSPSESIVKDPTRVELITAFVWKNFMQTLKSKNPHDHEARKRFVAVHAVNIRSRKEPPQLLENVFGNGAITVPTYNSSYEADEEFHELVGKLRSSIRSRIDNDYVMQAQHDDNHLNDLGELLSLAVRGDLEWCTFSSWCGFPIHEVDYGWGSPVWFTMTALPMKNFTVLTRSRSEDAIEATITMADENIEMLETQINKLM